MKQFSLEEYLRLKEEGKEPKIVTMDGKSVRIICTDRRNKFDKPIVAMVDGIDCEYPSCYTEKGKLDSHVELDDDLFFAPVKHEGWMNIFPLVDTNYATNVGGVIFPTKQMALEKSDGNCIATVKVEWEE